MKNQTVIRKKIASLPDRYNEYSTNHRVSKLVWDHEGDECNEKSAQPDECANRLGVSFDVARAVLERFYES